MFYSCDDTVKVGSREVEMEQYIRGLNSKISDLENVIDNLEYEVENLKQLESYYYSHNDKFNEIESTLSNQHQILEKNEENIDRLFGNDQILEKGIKNNKESIETLFEKNKIIGTVLSNLNNRR